MLPVEPRIHAPASCNSGHESGTDLTLGALLQMEIPRELSRNPMGTICLNLTSSAVAALMTT